MAKWQEISAQIYNDLKNHAPLVALLSSGVNGIQPVIGNESIGEQYITYILAFQKVPSKDGVYDFNISVRAFGPTYDDSEKIADKALGAIGASVVRYRLIGGETGYNDQAEFYIEQIFNIKK